MATVKSSIPDTLKREFNDAFAGENKSAVLTSLLRRAIEKRRRAQWRNTRYHALAIEEGALLVTVDDRYLRKARRLGSAAGLNEWKPPA